MIFHVARPRRAYHAKPQSGVAYAWVLVWMTAIIGVIALVIDLARVQVNRQEQYYAARSLATAALSTLAHTGDEGEMKERVLALAEELKILADGLPYTKNDISITRDGVDDYKTGGINITPGYWTTEQSVCTQFSPCFEPRTQTVGPPPTAVRVSLISRSRSPIHSMFAQFFGADSFRTRDEAVVALSPRTLIMAVDLSRSMQGESHFTSGSDSAEYAYRISYQPSGSDCSLLIGGTDNMCLSFEYGPSCVSPPDCYTECTFVGRGGVNSAQNISYNFKMATTSSGMGQASPHLQEDYQCFHGPVFDGPSNGADYLVDMVSDPLPLSTALRSLGEAMNSMQNSSIAGDLVGLIGFDSTAGDTVTHGASVVGRRQGLFSPILDRGEFLELQKIATYNNPVGTQPKFDENNLARIQHGFFPIASANATYTNMPAALAVARDMLATAKANNANGGVTDGRSYLIVAGDGITNCYADTGTSTSCGDNLAQYINSRNSTKNAISELQAEGITLVFMLFGQSGPHTLLIPKQGSNKCLTDQEARDTNTPYVDPSPLNGTTEQEFIRAQQDSSELFFDPNSFYNTIAPAGGIWVPIRPCYKENGKCVDLFDFGSAPSYRSSCSDLITFGRQKGFVIGSPGQPRMMVDPEGRTPERQAFDAIQKIMQDVNITTVANQRYLAPQI